MRSLLRINPYQQHFLKSMKRTTPYLAFLASLVVVVLIPSAAHAATYTATYESKYLNTYAFEYTIVANGCTELHGYYNFKTQAECDARRTTEIKAHPEYKAAACSKIDKTSYQITLAAPVCPSTITAYGLKTSDGAGGTANKTNDGKGGTATKSGAEGGSAQTLKNPLKFNSLPELLNAVLDAVIELGAILLVFMLVWVGFLFVTAQGNPEKVSTARSALLWTLIGGLILLGAKAISLVVQSTVTSITP
jgi:hypothetical protein